MANKYLGRDDAPFGDELWAKLDGVMASAAKSQLAGRRLLEIEGPYGIGLKALPASDVNVDVRWAPYEEEMEAVAEESSEEEELDDSLFPVEVHASSIIPVASIRTGFTLGIRDLANYEREGVDLDLGSVAAAALALATAEDDLVFFGSDALGTFGLLNEPGSHSVKLSAWKKPGEAADDVIAALTQLDSSGFHGPYSLALAPARYNLLFRRYAQGHHTELEHLKSFVTDGIIKAPVMKDGGVLIATAMQSASIVLGQDMTIGFVGPVSGELEFSISESLALRVRQAKAICLLQS
jgi:uncharacterized linocin/CFP29 family protein